MKKWLTIAIAIFLILGVSIYLRKQSSYELVQNEMKKQIEEKYKDENQDTSNSEEDNQSSEEENSIKSIEDFNRSEEDIAMDKRIKDQRLKNEESWKKMGGISSLTSGKGFSPKRTLDDITSSMSALKDYRDSNSKIYTKDDSMPTADPRFEELIWGKPKEERNSLLEGHNDEDMYMVQLKRLDGEYDEVFLVRYPDSGEWSVEYVGNYYDFKEKVQ